MLGHGRRHRLADPGLPHGEQQPRWPARRRRRPSPTSSCASTRPRRLLRKNPALAAQTYVKTYGVPLAVAKEAVASDQTAGTPITPAIVDYQQNEANTFLKLGLLTTPINVKKVFDLPFNKTVDKAAGIS